MAKSIPSHSDRSYCRWLCLTVLHPCLFPLPHFCGSLNAELTFVSDRILPHFQLLPSTHGGTRDMNRNLVVYTFIFIFGDFQFCTIMTLCSLQNCLQMFHCGSVSVAFVLTERANIWAGVVAKWFHHHLQCWLFGCWFKSLLFYFQSSSLLMFPGNQQKKTQVLGSQHANWRPGSCSWLQPF